MQNKKTLLFTFYLAFSILGYFLFCYLQVNIFQTLGNLCLYVAGFCTIQALDIIFEFKNKMKYMLIALVSCFLITGMCTYDLGEEVLELALNWAAAITSVGLVIALFVKSKKKNIYD